MFEPSLLWKSTYPTACVGVLALRDVANPPAHAELDRQKELLESDLQRRFGGMDRAALKALPVLQAYDAYYRRFDKTYHVQLQLESIVHKGKSIPHVAALVEAMFMAEVKNLLLTAGHDLDVVQPPLTLDVARGGETYTLLRGQEQQLKPGDMVIRDRAGVISGIVYGPDGRTQIRPETKSAVFTVYGVPGISPEAVRAHLQDIETYARIIASEAQTEMLQVFGT